MMSMFTERLSLMVVGSIVAVVMTLPAQGVMIVTGGGTTVFEDNFESAPELAPLDADPVAQVGTYSIVKENAPGNGGSDESIQVTDAGSPGPFQGDNYLKVSRDTGDLGSVYLRGAFDQAVNSGLLNVSMMRYFDSATVGTGTAASIYTYFKVQGGNQQRIRMTSHAIAGNLVELFHRDGGDATTTTGLTFPMDQWVQVDFSLDLDTSKYTVSVDGNTSPVFDFHTAGNTADEIRIDQQLGRLSYFDAVIPEPSSMVLCLSLVAAGIGLPRYRLC